SGGGGGAGRGWNRRGGRGAGAGAAGAGQRLGGRRQGPAARAGRARRAGRGTRPGSSNRLQRHFEAARRSGRRSLVVYLCGGDPDLASTERLVPALAAAGADVIEIGVPFSDP